MEEQITILVVEDNEDDFLFIRKFLRAENGYRFHLERATRLQQAREAISLKAPDVVLLDLALPDSFGLATFDAIHLEHPRIPIVILTGHDSIELGLKAVKSGAQEFITKEHLSGPMLATVLRHAMERQKLMQALQEALEEVKVLRGFIPICAHCKKIRDDEGYWQQIEQYISRHSEARFSHGICPQCMKEHYPDIEDSREG